LPTVVDSIAVLVNEESEPALSVPTVVDSIAVLVSDESKPALYLPTVVDSIAVLVNEESKPASSVPTVVESAGQTSRRTDECICSVLQIISTTCFAGSERRLHRRPACAGLHAETWERSENPAKFLKMNIDI